MMRVFATVAVVAVVALPERAPEKVVADIDVAATDVRPARLV